MNRPALGSFPSAEWAETIHSGLLSVAPKGTPHLFTQVRRLVHTLTRRQY